MICEILAVSAEKTRNELSQKPAAITNLKQVELEKWKFWVLSEFYRLSTVATKLFGFILIFCEKSSPKCLLACCPVLLVTTAKTGSIERGRFTELGPWSAYDGDWVGAEQGRELLLDPSCCFFTKQNHGFHALHWQLWQKWRIWGFSAKLDCADFCRFCYLFGIKFGPIVHLSKFESGWLGHPTTAAVPLLKVNCLFG